MDCGAQQLVRPNSGACRPLRCGRCPPFHDGALHSSTSSPRAQPQPLHQLRHLRTHDMRYTTRRGRMEEDKADVQQRKPPRRERFSPQRGGRILQRVSPPRRRSRRPRRRGRTVHRESRGAGVNACANEVAQFIASPRCRSQSNIG
jgi:hypothetical protein